MIIVHCSSIKSSGLVHFFDIDFLGVQLMMYYSSIQPIDAEVINVLCMVSIDHFGVTSLLPSN